MEGGVGSVFHEAGDRLRQGLSQYEGQVRREPARAVFFALVIGYLLRSLPIAQLLGGIARLFLALLRPAALLFAAMKILEAAQLRTRRVHEAELEREAFPR
jgi:hypothetical protein